MRSVFHRSDFNRKIINRLSLSFKGQTSKALSYANIDKMCTCFTRDVVLNSIVDVRI